MGAADRSGMNSFERVHMDWQAGSHQRWMEVISDALRAGLLVEVHLRCSCLAI